MYSIGLLKNLFEITLQSAESGERYFWQCIVMYIDNQTTSAINTVEKDYIPDVKLNTSKLCEDFKERNVNISDVHLLNIDKT